MKINYEFTVGTPIGRAWNTMLDLERIAPCLPGASLTEETGDGEYAGTIVVRIGPLSASYEGTVKFEEADEANHRAVLQATGRDARGQGTASATIVSTLHEEGENTKVNVETDMELTGRAAQFGSGIAQDVAARMLDQFAACLEREISGASTGEAAAEPAPENGSRTQPAPGSTTISGEGPAVAGGTVEGAIVAGSSPSGAAAGAPTTSTRRPTMQDAPRRRPAEEAKVPGAADQGAPLERLTPVLALAGALVFLVWLLRRKR